MGWYREGYYEHEGYAVAYVEKVRGSRLYRGVRVRFDRETGTYPHLCDQDAARRRKRRAS